VAEAQLTFRGRLFLYCGNDLLHDLWPTRQARLQLFLDAVLSEDAESMRAHVMRHIHGAATNDR
jgi:hypothetical protein